MKTTMIRGAFVTALFLVLGVSAKPLDEQLPTFTWVAKDSSGGLDMVKFKIDFNDGGKPAVVQLAQIFDEDMPEDEEEEQNECSYKGKGDNELSVLVLGCYGSKSFTVSLSSHRLASPVYNVENGVTSPYKPIPNDKSGVEDDERVQTVTPDEATMRILNETAGEVTDRELPSVLEVRVALKYDHLFLNDPAVGNGRKYKANERAREIVSLAQSLYDHYSLGQKVKITITSLDYVDVKRASNRMLSSVQLKNGRTSCNAGCTLDRVSKYMTKNDPEKGVDNFHYLSRDFNAGTSGIARTVSYSGWKFSGSVCMDNKDGDRTAITEVYGPKGYTWNQMRVDAGETFAHELGHALGMPHDFSKGNDKDSPPRRDSSGRSCINGPDKPGTIMSYQPRPKTVWSKCSSEALQGWFNQLSKTRRNCKVKAPCEDLCNKGNRQCPLRSNGRRAYICDKPEEWGNYGRTGCNGSWKNEFKENCAKTCGYCEGGSPSPRPRPNPGPRPSKCRDTSSLCKHYVKQWWKDCNDNWSKENCKKSCRVCY